MHFLTFSFVRLEANNDRLSWMKIRTTSQSYTYTPLEVDQKYQVSEENNQSMDAAGGERRIDVSYICNAEKVPICAYVINLLLV